MWILPRPLHTSPYVPDTAGLISDLNEQSQLCAQSLLLRSKPSPARTWSAKWKRDSWTRHLSGRILKPSLGPTFTTAWTSSVVATRASHSPPPASVSVPTTPDISGHTYQPELLQCAQVSVSLKTSKDISRWGCPTSSKTWQDWVTERRGAYSQRLKSAQSISVRVSSSWPTANARDWKDSITGTHPPSRPKIGEQTLGQAVSVMHGQAAPANGNTTGNRQGLWATPRSGMSAGSKDAEWQPGKKPAVNGQAITTSLTDQVRIAQQWPTITAHTPDMESNGPNGHQGTYLAGAVKTWATPKASDPQHSGPNMRDSAGNYALPAQAVREQWGTPTARDHKSGRGNEDRQYKELTPMVERQQSGKLNPRWVETLMGLPIGWTMPSCTSPQTIAPMSCDSSAMELCLPPQSGLFEFCLQS